MAASSLLAALTHLRNGNTSIRTFGGNPWPHKLWTATKVDIFDVQDGNGAQL